MCEKCKCNTAPEPENLEPIIFDDALTAICNATGLHEQIITVGGCVTVADVLRYYRKLNKALSVGGYG